MSIDKTPLLLVACLFAAACSRKADPPLDAPKAAAPVADKPAPAASWGKSSRVLSTLTLQGVDVKLDMMCCNQKGLAPVTMHKVPAGTKVTVGRTEWQPKTREGMPAEGLAYFDADVGNGLGKVSFDVFRVEAKPPAPRAEVEVPITMALPGFQTIETRFVGEADLEWPLYHVLERVTAGSVQLAAEEPARGTPDAAVILWAADTGFLSAHKTRTGLTLADLDWIAIPTRVPSGKSITCSGYVGFGGGVGRSATFEKVGLDLTVYDRATGKVVGKHSFAPPTACPKIMTSGDNVITPPNAILDTWMDGALKRGVVD